MGGKEGYVICEHSNVYQSHSQNDSGDLRGVAGGDGKLWCLCGKAGTSDVCGGSTHPYGYVHGQLPRRISSTNYYCV